MQNTRIHSNNMYVYQVRDIENSISFTKLKNMHSNIINTSELCNELKTPKTISKSSIFSNKFRKHRYS